MNGEILHIIIAMIHYMPISPASSSLFASGEQPHHQRWCCRLSILLVVGGFTPTSQPNFSTQPKSCLAGIHPWTMDEINEWMNGCTTSNVADHQSVALPWQYEIERSKFCFGFYANTFYAIQMAKVVTSNLFMDVTLRFLSFYYLCRFLYVQLGNCDQHKITACTYVQTGNVAKILTDK